MNYSLEELKQLAGCDEPSAPQPGLQVKPVPIPSPIDQLQMKMSNNRDVGLESLSDRLNSLLGSNNFKVERLWFF